MKEGEKKVEYLQERQHVFMLSYLQMTLVELRKELHLTKERVSSLEADNQSVLKKVRQLEEEKCGGRSCGNSGHCGDFSADVDRLSDFVSANRLLVLTASSKRRGASRNKKREEEEEENMKRLHMLHTSHYPCKKVVT